MRNGLKSLLVASRLFISLILVEIGVIDKYLSLIYELKKVARSFLSPSLPLLDAGVFSTH